MPPRHLHLRNSSPNIACLVGPSEMKLYTFGCQIPIFCVWLDFLGDLISKGIKFPKFEWDMIPSILGGF